MSLLSELYQQALFSAKQQHLPLSINDLLIKDLNEEPLSSIEKKALQNYHQFKHQLLSSAKDDNDFADKIIKLRIIANFTSWKEFIHYQEMP